MEPTNVGCVGSRGTESGDLDLSDMKGGDIVDLLRGVADESPVELFELEY